MRRREFIAGIAAAASLPHSTRAAAGYAGDRFLSNAAAKLTRYALRVSPGYWRETGFVEGTRTLEINYRWANNDNDRLASLAATSVWPQRCRVDLGGRHPSARCRLAAPPQRSRSCLRRLRQSGRDRVDFALEPAGRQCDGRDQSERRDRAEAAGGTARTAAEGDDGGRSGQSNEPRRRRYLPSGDPSCSARHGIQIERLAGQKRRRSGDGIRIACEGAHGCRTLSAPMFSSIPAASGSPPWRCATGSRRSTSTCRFAAAGGLVSYGQRRDGVLSRLVTGSHAGKILKGEKPGDLPRAAGDQGGIDHQSQDCAKTPGVTVPLSLLGRADEVIE